MKVNGSQPEVAKISQCSITTFKKLKTEVFKNNKAAIKAASQDVLTSI